MAGAPQPPAGAAAGEHASEGPGASSTPDDARPSRGGRRRSRLLLALFLLALLLLALEIVVRVGGLVELSRGVATEHQAAFNASDPFVSVSDPALSYTNRPLANATIDGIAYRHDDHGWRVMPDAAKDADAGGGLGTGASDTTAGSAAGATHGAAADSTAAPVVAFFGDSTTYGLSLPAQDTLPAQVAAALRAAGTPIVARNLGVCGYATDQEAALYEAQRGALADASVIVLVFFPNDFARGTFLWDSGFRLMYVDPLPVPFALKSRLWNSALYRALVSRLGSSDAVRNAFDASNPDNQALALQAVERFAALVRADGKRLLVAHLPAMERLDPYLFERPVSGVAATCARLGVPYVDLLPAFLAERTRQVADYEARGGVVTEEQRAQFLAQYWVAIPSDHHLNAAANRIAAAALAAALAPLLAAP